MSSTTKIRGLSPNVGYHRCNQINIDRIIIIRSAIYIFRFAPTTNNNWRYFAPIKSKVLRYAAAAILNIIVYKFSGRVVPTIPARNFITISIFSQPLINIIIYLFKIVVINKLLSELEDLILFSIG
jgi:hypothetical protein